MIVFCSLYFVLHFPESPSFLFTLYLWYSLTYHHFWWLHSFLICYSWHTVNYKARASSLLDGSSSLAFRLACLGVGSDTVFNRNCTLEVWLLDLNINQILKEDFQNLFTDWYAEKVSMDTASWAVPVAHRWSKWQQGMCGNLHRVDLASSERFRLRGSAKACSALTRIWRIAWRCVTLPVCRGYVEQQ